MGPRSRSLVALRDRVVLALACALGAMTAAPVAAQLAFSEPAELGDGPDPDCVAEVHAALEARSTGASPSSVASAHEEAVEAVEARVEDAVEEPGALVASAPAEVAHAPRSEPIASQPDLPIGRAIGSLDAQVCLDVLEAHHVRFSRLDDPDLNAVGIPIRLDGPLAGVEVRSRGGSELHEIMDCRLAVALLAWAPSLYARGVRRVLHYSTFRPGARVARSGHISGHAKGLAIDLAILELADGSSVDVLHGWEARERGQSPCEAEVEEGERSAELRRMVCAAASADLFQVVLTPHYDRAHGNHVHLEVVPGVPWSFVH